MKMLGVSFCWPKAVVVGFGGIWLIFRPAVIRLFECGTLSDDFFVQLRYVVFCFPLQEMFRNWSSSVQAHYSGY